MGRRSSIEVNLPDEVIIEVNEKLEEGFTLDQVLGWLAELGHGDDVSRSALGRYKMKHDDLSGELKRSRLVAEALAREKGDEDDGQIGRIGIEMLHAITMKMTAATMSGRMPDFSPREIAYLAKSQKDMMGALDIDDRRRAKIREEAAKEALEKAAGEVADIAQQRGWKAETAKHVQSKILGVKL